MNIHVTAFSCLARGGNDVVLKLGNKIDIFNEPILVELAKKYKKSVASIVLAFWVVQGLIYNFFKYLYSLNNERFNFHIKH